MNVTTVSNIIEKEKVGMIVEKMMLNNDIYADFLKAEDTKKFAEKNGLSLNNEEIKMFDKMRENIMTIVNNKMEEITITLGILEGAPSYGCNGTCW